jgi:transcriptional regulator with XRE-family HTH domain
MAARRLAQLLSGRKVGSSWLRTLRELHGVSQVDIASRLGIQQGNISKLERRSKVQLGTVVKLVAALGGSIQIQAKFPDAEFPLDLGALAQPHPSSRPRRKVNRTGR